MILSESSILSNYLEVLERIEGAARFVGRDPERVRLVVVTKGHDLDRIRSAIRAGAHLLGENYVEEAIPKIQVLSSHSKIEWHMIGHVQSRKAKRVSEYFNCVHTLDSYKLAGRLNRFAGEFGNKLPVLFEFNVSGEASKYGIPAWQEKHWGDLLELLEPIVELPNLQVRGLMTMAPMVKDPEEARVYFRRSRKLRDFLANYYVDHDWSELSMGMSSDFEVAVEEGATILRIGQAILGPRPE
jgi:pyridoxal phosphate enzyme (YggS family)